MVAKGGERPLARPRVGGSIAPGVAILQRPEYIFGLLTCGRTNAEVTGLPSFRPIRETAHLVLRLNETAFLVFEATPTRAALVSTDLSTGA